MQKKDNAIIVDESQAEVEFKIGDAASYDAVVGFFDQYTERFTNHLPGPMLAMANLPAQATILDIGTGTGIVALNVADLVGPQCEVVGIDLSEEMLRVATEKAVQMKLNNRVSFLRMDAENLQLDDNSFDAALSLYALRHFPNPGKSVSEIYRVLKPGGKIVVAVGSRPTILSRDGLMAAARRLSSIGRRLRGKELSACEFIDSLVDKYIPKDTNKEIAEWVGEHHGFSGSIRDLVEKAGFGSIQSAWKGQYSTIESAEDFWQIQLTFSSLARKRIAQADEITVQKLKSEFLASCERVLERKGRLVYQTGAAIVSGTKASS